MKNDVEEIPEWMMFLKDRVEKKFEGTQVEQMIINRYRNGHSIAKHFDNVKYFGPVVGILTLGCEVINFFFFPLKIYQKKKKKGSNQI